MKLDVRSTYLRLSTGRNIYKTMTQLIEIVYEKCLDLFYQMLLELRIYKYLDDEL